MAAPTEPVQSSTSVTAEAEGLQAPPAQAAYLVLVGSAGKGGLPEGDRLLPIGPGLEIGRGRPRSSQPGSYLIIDDRWVSSTHARVAPAAGGFEIVDFESRNGTFVDGVAVKRQPLRDGALLLFGGCAAVFRFLSRDAVAAIEADLAQPFGPLPTASPAMADSIRRLRRLAPTRETLFLTGETGTGKEVYARAIHRASGRSGKLVGLNCAALPNELVESELFGYVRGAHSQAAQAKRGLVEEADGGTLFLDEISEMAPRAQAKLLRFLEEREVLPLGSSQARRVDVRVLAATSTPEADQEGLPLRKDLLMRLGSQPIFLPALRDRLEDIGVLSHHFLESREVAFDNSAFLALCLHGWPGNVRELGRVIREAAVLREGHGPIGLEHLPPGFAARLRGSSSQPPQPAQSPQPPEGSQPPPRRRSPRPAPSREELERLLAEQQGRIADVARLLDCRWSVVWRWIKRYGLNPDQIRARR